MYFVRAKRAGSRLTTFLYIDDEFVGVLEDNSFTYALVQEGRHVLWTFLTLDAPKWFKKVSNLGTKAVVGVPLFERPWEGSEFEVLGGRRYYFGFADPDSVRNTHLRLDVREGADRVDRVKFYAAATEKETEASALHLAERPTGVVEHFEAIYVEIPDYPAPQVPLDVTGLIPVDADSEISLELVQHLWSERDSSGDEVWLRVTKDLASTEGVWLREGTLVRGLMRHAEGRRSSVQGGILEVAIPAVVAVDGTVVPTHGEIREQGGEPSEANEVLWNLFRALEILAGGDYGPQGGSGAYLPLGSTTTIYTRDPVWIAPTSRAMESAERKASPSALRLRLAPKTVSLSGGFWPRLRFLVGRPERPALVRVRSIAGQSPPVEIEAEKLTRVPEGWLCAFDWWQLLKFLPITNGQGHIPLELEGVLEDGTPFVVEVPVRLDLPSQE